MTTVPEPRPPASEPTTSQTAGPPATGHPGIDAALAGLVLGEDVHTHHDALAAALESVQRALNPPQPLPPPSPAPPRPAAPNR